MRAFSFCTRFYWNISWHPLVWIISLKYRLLCFFRKFFSVIFIIWIFSALLVTSSKVSIINILGPFYQNYSLVHSGYMCQDTLVEVRGQLGGASSLLPSCGLQGTNSAHQVWWKASLVDELSCQLWYWIFYSKLIHISCMLVSKAVFLFSPFVFLMLSTILSILIFILVSLLFLSFSCPLHLHFWIFFISIWCIHVLSHCPLIFIYIIYIMDSVCIIHIFFWWPFAGKKAMAYICKWQDKAICK